MLDPRIYRAALVPFALALVVLAFSLYDQQGALGTSLAPDAFNAQSAYARMTTLARAYPAREPGSASDDALATYVGHVFSLNGFTVSTNVFAARTAVGKRTLETVTGMRPGFSSRPIVVIAHRDARGSPATVEMSGTATLLELARVLSGRTLNRTVELVSTSGSIGAAGATHLAQALGTSVDAVLVLGDLAGARLRYPLVVPWSDAQNVAPPMLRNTVAAALGAQTGLMPGGLSLGGQFAHLAFPLSISDQGPFGAQGAPAVLLSASSERRPAPDATPSPARLTTFGRAALQIVSALEDGGQIPAPAPYLVYDKKVVPAWAFRLLVLALILPVLAAGIDAYARARRRGYAVGRWVAWVLAGAVPFVLSALLLLGLKLTGLLPIAPPGPVDAASVPPHSAGVAILICTACVVVLSLVFLWPRLGRLAGASRHTTGDDAGVAVTLVMGLASLAIWVGNPFAAALVVPALNVWIWIVAPDVGLGRPVRLVLLVVGAAPLVSVVVYYAASLGQGPVGLAWTAVLMLAGGQLSPLVALEWCLMLGCTASVVTIAWRNARQRELAEHSITVRGPATYAGPGSLGGTESALRR